MNRDEFAAKSLSFASKAASKAQALSESSTVLFLASGRTQYAAASTAAAPLLKRLSDHTKAAAAKFSARNQQAKVQRARSAHAARVRQNAKKSGPNAQSRKGNPVSQGVQGAQRQTSPTAQRNQPTDRRSPGSGGSQSTRNLKRDDRGGRGR